MSEEQPIKLTPMVKEARVIMETEYEDGKVQRICFVAERPNGFNMTQSRGVVASEGGGFKPAEGPCHLLIHGYYDRTTDNLPGGEDEEPS